MTKQFEGSEMRVHIGDHYMGAGNIGDDWMLAGFLMSWRRWGSPCSFTCATPFDRRALAHRFPEVDWLPYDLQTRSRAVMNCDVWLGLGATPFQNDTGPWMIEHHETERELCEKYDAPRFFLCVGANNGTVFDDPRAVAFARSAIHIWARDRQCAGWLGQVTSPGSVTLGADLANIYFESKQRRLASVDVGWLLHAEDCEVLAKEPLRLAINTFAGKKQTWLVQEVRELPGSERERYQAFSDTEKRALSVAIPSYSIADVDGLYDAWPACTQVVSTRYHGGLWAAWSGARLVLIERNDKLRGLSDELGCRRLPALKCAEELERELTAALPVQPQVLNNLVERANRSCDEFFQRALAVHAKRNAGLTRRVGALLERARDKLATICNPRLARMRKLFGHKSA